MPLPRAPDWPRSLSIPPKRCETGKNRTSATCWNRIASPPRPSRTSFGTSAALISLVCSNLKHKRGFQSDEDFQGLANLVDGLEKITALELNSLAKEQVEETALQPMLDSLRIVIESAGVEGNRRRRCAGIYPDKLHLP